MRFFAPNRLIQISMFTQMAAQSFFSAHEALTFNESLLNAGRAPTAQAAAKRQLRVLAFLLGAPAFFYTRGQHLTRKHPVLRL